MRAGDSDTDGKKAKAEPGTDAYAERVAKPTMEAIDAMAPEWRALVHEFGYVDVYRAWRRGWTVLEVRKRAQECGGRFAL